MRGAGAALLAGFTELSQGSSTAGLMLMLNELFSAFDQALDRHGVYKVETIGDAYMCVTGHDGVGNHAERMAGWPRIAPHSPAPYTQTPLQPGFSS